VSASLTVEIDAGPIERARADVAVVFLFDSDRPLRGGAGRADWRMCGRLSKLLVAGRLTGARGEAVLMATDGGMAAPRVIALGVGARNTFDADACAELGAQAVDRARRLAAKTLALPLPDPHAGDLSLAERIEALVEGAVRALAEVSADLRLRLVPPGAEVGRADKALAELVSKLRPGAVELRVARPAQARRVPDPQGGQPSADERPQFVK